MSTHHEEVAVAQPHKHPNYLGVFITLAVLTAVLTTIELMSQAGVINWPRPTLNTLYLSISVAQAVLVAMHYMHLKADSSLHTILFGVPVLFAVVFFVILLI